MAIQISPVEVGARDVMGAQTGDAIDVADGAVSAALDGGGYYRIIATSACTVRIGDALADATGGETWPENNMETGIVPDGFVVACDA